MKNLIRYITHLITVFFVFSTSCQFKIKDINGSKFIKNKSYLVLNEKNKIFFKNNFWIVDSISFGKIQKEDKMVIIEPKDSTHFYDNFIIAHSKFLNREKTLKIVSSKLPIPIIKQFPYDIVDTIDYDNIRFLRYRLVTDTVSFVQVNSNVNEYFYHFDSISFINGSNSSSKDQMDYIFKNKPKKIFIDSVYYWYNSNFHSEKIEKSFVIKYPSTDKYSCIDKNPFTNFHVNSLSSIYNLVPKQKRIIEGNIIEYECEILSTLFKKRPFINLGEIGGINLITVLDENNEVIYKRLIDGSNQRIDDFLFWDDYPLIKVTVRGKHDWNMIINFL